MSVRVKLSVRLDVFLMQHRPKSPSTLLVAVYTVRRAQKIYQSKSSDDVIKYFLARRSIGVILNPNKQLLKIIVGR